ncbi:hypothetical protein ACQP2Y_12855 [Actinoplanes sp. CA-051413]|uniref:hypothetical protein n=1 Tax=Actinoplanes sp. CA-051413 TaxID=3239899 RepID=UPI003D99EC07
MTSLSKITAVTGPSAASSRRAYGVHLAAVRRGLAGPQRVGPEQHDVFDGGSWDKDMWAAAYERLDSLLRLDYVAVPIDTAGLTTEPAMKRQQASTSGTPWTATRGKPGRSPWGSAPRRGSHAPGPG